MQTVAIEELVVRAQPYNKIVKLAYQKLNEDLQHESWHGEKGLMYKYEIVFDDGTKGIYNSEFSQKNPFSFPLGQEVCFKVNSVNRYGAKISPCKESIPVTQPSPGEAAKEPKNTTYHPETTHATGSIALSPGYLALKLAVEASQGRDWMPIRTMEVANEFKQYILNNLK